jgi:RNase P subunit RPR2
MGSRRERLIKVKFPSYDVYVTSDEERFQCENCGAILPGGAIEMEHIGRTGSIIIVKCPRCGNKCYHDELVTFAIRIIPKDSRIRGER